jgi:hypothetical protein
MKNHGLFKRPRCGPVHSPGAQATERRYEAREVRLHRVDENAASQIAGLLSYRPLERVLDALLNGQAEIRRDSHAAMPVSTKLKSEGDWYGFHPSRFDPPGGEDYKWSAE